jgi:hypothetical protein
MSGNVADAERSSAVLTCQGSAARTASLCASHESADPRQARVNRNWRFYFTIVSDTYIIEDVIAHPK